MEKDHNLIDIIVINYNSTDYLLKCLESVYDSLGDLRANVFVQHRLCDQYHRGTLQQRGGSRKGRNCQGAAVEEWPILLLRKVLQKLMNR